MKNKIIKTQIIVMFFMIIGKAVGFLREIILASKFGTSYEMDIYSFCITLLLFLATIGYGITTTIIPIFAELKVKRNFKDQERIANNLISTVLILGILISLLSLILSKYIVRLFAPGFVSDSFEIAQKLMIIMNFSIIFILIQSVITGILQANGKFYAPAAMSFISNSITVIYLILLLDKFGIIGFGIVTVIAYFSQLLINYPSYKKIGYKYYFYVNIREEEMIEIFKLSIPILASTCIMQLGTFVNNFFGSLMVEGAISIYNYSNRLISLGVEIFPIAISMVIYPLLAKVGADDNKEEFNKVLGQGLILISIVIVPISILMIILRVDIIRVLYERNSFTEYSTLITSQMLLVLIPTMLAGGIRDLINKACYSLKEVKLPMRVSIFTILITIFTNSVLYKRVGISTLGISTSITTVAGCLIILVLLKKKYKFIKLNIGNSIIKVLFSSFLMGIVAYTIKYFLTLKMGVSTLSSIITIGGSAIVCSIIYVILLIMFKVKELNIIMNKKSNN